MRQKCCGIQNNLRILPCPISRTLHLWTSILLVSTSWSQMSCFCQQFSQLVQVKQKHPRDHHHQAAQPALRPGVGSSGKASWRQEGLEGTGPHDLADEARWRVYVRERPELLTVVFRLHKGCMQLLSTVFSYCIMQFFVFKKIVLATPSNIFTKCILHTRSSACQHSAQSKQITAVESWPALDRLDLLTAQAKPGNYTPCRKKVRQSTTSEHRGTAFFTKIFTIMIIRNHAAHRRF